VLKLDRLRLAGELQRLPILGCGAFAAAAATRIFPAYVTYCDLTGNGDSGQLNAALQCVWSFLEEAIRDSETLQRQHTIAEALTDIPDTPASRYRICAQDATAAVTYCLRFLLGHDTKDAVRAAYCSYDAAWQYALLSMVTGLQIDSADDTEKWLSHPLVQTELSRQERDLTNLKNANPYQLTATVRGLRDLSEHECVVPLAGS